MPRSARSAALLDMHRRPSSRKRVSEVQRLRPYWIALAISLCADSLRRCSRSQVSSATTSGRLRSLRTRLRSCGGLPFISRSIANSASMRSTASIAIGALLMRARSKSLRRACAQHDASVIGPGRREAS